MCDGAGTLDHIRTLYHLCPGVCLHIVTHILPTVLHLYFQVL